jgi:hypothetical protein
MKKFIALVAVAAFLFAVAAPSYAAYDKDPKAPKTETKKTETKKTETKKDCAAASSCKDAKAGSSCCGSKAAAEKK